MQSAQVAINSGDKIDPCRLDPHNRASRDISQAFPISPSAHFPGRGSLNDQSPQFTPSGATATAVRSQRPPVPAFRSPSALLPQRRNRAGRAPVFDIGHLKNYTTASMFRHGFPRQALDTIALSQARYIARDARQVRTDFHLAHKTTKYYTTKRGRRRRGRQSRPTGAKAPTFCDSIFSEILKIFDFVNIS